MNRIQIFVLNQPNEIYTKYVDVQSALAFITRTGRIRNFLIIIQKGNNARVWEPAKATSLIELQREMMDFAAQA